MNRNINAELLSSLLKRKSSYEFEEEIARRERDRRNNLSITGSSSKQSSVGKPNGSVHFDVGWSRVTQSIWKKIKPRKKP